MDLIILLPVAVCWCVLARRSARHALVYVYLPVVLMLPGYYVLKLPHLPPVTFNDAVILPLGAAMVATEMRRWRLAWMDLWVFLFALSAALSEGLSTELAYGGWVRLFSADSAASTILGYNINNGVFEFFAVLTTILLPYMAGKLLVENRTLDGRPMRKAVIRQMVGLLAVVAAISTIDFISAKNSWQRLFHTIFPDQAVVWDMQVRWGFGRIAGPFGHAILAGMVFLMAVVYGLWLFWVDREWGKRKVMAGVPLTQRRLILVAVFAGLIMTQSRGPWIGMFLAVLFALLSRAMSIGKAAVVFAVLLAVLGGTILYVGDRYTRVEHESGVSEEQASAIYRRELLQSFAPVIKQRIAFGWGFTDYPSANGQKSIDNQFLWMLVTQGLVGLGVFSLIAAGSGIRLLHLASMPLGAEDRSMVFAHMAVLLGVLATLATVYMGEQVVIVFFMVIGWIQGMNPKLLPMKAEAAQYRFRQVLV